ncbi:MAG TPA: hypothetical protein VLF94_00400 [Chlamydiales bacterium]|nr:hypothetical protein [Chlamydiales bacterium]
MVGSVPPTGPHHHKGEFVVPPGFRKMWTEMFKASGTVPTDEQMSKMTDQFINQVWNDCNSVLQKALAAQKKLDQKYKEDNGS